VTRPGYVGGLDATLAYTDFSRYLRHATRVADSAFASAGGLQLTLLRVGFHRSPCGSFNFPGWWKSRRRGDQVLIAVLAFEFSEYLRRAVQRVVHIVPGKADGDDGSCRAWVEDGAIEIPPFVGARVGVPIAGAVYTSFVSPGKDVGDVVACFCVVWPELDTGREREQVVPVITAVEICLFEKVGRCETER